MKPEYKVEELVPHSGRMRLIDEIVDHGEDWLHAEVRITEESMFVEAQGVPAWIGLEYLAQTVAAFAGLQERMEGEEPKLGFLVGTRKYVCSKGYFKIGRVLSLKVEKEMETEAGLSVFKCGLHGQEVEASAILNVFQPEDVNKFLRDSIK